MCLPVVSGHPILLRHFAFVGEGDLPNLQRVVIVFSEYRDIDGLTVAHQAEYWGDGNLMGTFVVDEAVFNNQVHSAIFQMPESDSESNTGG